MRRVLRLLAMSVLATGVWAAPATPSFADYNATLDSQSGTTLSLKKGIATSVWVRLNNTGSDTWDSNVRVGAVDAYGNERQSAFCDSGTWVACGHRPGGLQDNVPSGGVGHFRFVMKAPATTGTYTERFKLLREGVAWFGPEFTWTITVTDDDAQSPSLGAPFEIGAAACRVEAEDYDYGGQNVAWYDTTAGNAGLKYRRDDVDIQACSDTGGGYNVYRIVTGEWLRYTVNVASGGDYQIRLRVAASGSGGSYRIELNGVDKTGTRSTGGTGGSQTWTTTAAVPASLSAGNNQVLRFHVVSGAFNLNWILIEPAGCGVPVITTHPSDASKIAGETATFQVTATGMSLSYQWQKKPSGGNWGDISGATSAQYTTAVLQVSDNGSQYRCVVINACGSQTSSAATLTVTNWSVTPAEGATRTAVAGLGTCGNLSPVEYTLANAMTTGSLQYTVAKQGDCGWLALDKASGALVPGTPETVTGTIDAGGLSIGEHHCDLVFSNDTGLTKLRTVTLIVLGTVTTWEYHGNMDPRDPNAAGPGLRFALVEGMDNGDMTGPGIVQDDPLAHDGKVWRIQDPSGAKTKFQTRPNVPILGGLGATIVGRVRVRSTTAPQEGGLYIWEIEDGLSTAYHWGGAADGRVQEVYRQNGVSLPADDQFHILRMTVQGVDPTTRTARLYFDEGSSPVVDIPYAAFKGPGGLIMDEGFGFGAGSTSGTYDIAFDWVTATNAGAFAPGEEMACLGRSLIPSDGPMIGLSSGQFNYSLHCGETLEDDSFTVKNTGVGTLNYTIEVDQPWLVVYPDNGNSTGEEDSITISYNNIGGLSPWWPHVATITVHDSDGNAGNDPQTLTVGLMMETAAEDFDGDCDVDQSDFGHLQACLGGPGVAPPPGPGCADCDLNGDGSCDSADVALLRGRMTGANAPTAPTGDVPQYIFFNKAPTAAGSMVWNQANPASFTPESCEEIVQSIGTRGSDRLRIGVSFPFSILDTNVGTLAQSLQNLLAAAATADVPVLVTLDGQNWWETRADLWNWWDTNLAGFNPDNRYNVEWTGWGPEYAVKIGWRNWGSQIRVRPAPNLASPTLLAEYWYRYDVLVPIIMEWYRALPSNRKYLFGGLKLGWEASINVNAYYHENGNDYLEYWPNDPSHDPSGSLHDAQQGWTWGLPPLGYAAVATSGIKQSGELTKDDIEQVLHQYLERLSEAAYRRGIPRHLIFTHQGGTYAPWDKHLSFKPAMNGYSVPGWSFYSHDPAYCGSLASDLESAGREQWAASEWWRGAADENGWRQRFEASLNFKQCRLVCVYNWETFKDIPAALAAVRDLVAQTEPLP